MLFNNLPTGEPNAHFLRKSYQILHWDITLSLWSKQEVWRFKFKMSMRRKRPYLPWLVLRLFWSPMLTWYYSEIWWTVIYSHCLFQWTKETGRICCHALAVIYCTSSAWSNIKSNDDPMWYSLPFHVTTHQRMYGPIPVLPTTSHWMEANPVFSEQCHRKCRARKKNRYTSDLTQGAQNYLCKLCGDQGHYA